MPAHAINTLLSSSLFFPTLSFVQDLSIPAPQAALATNVNLSEEVLPGMLAIHAT